MKIPTLRQIKTEIKKLQALKPRIRSHSIFGDSNLDCIDAQVEVLEHDLTEEDIANREIYEDGSGADPEDDSAWKENVASAARAALQWRDGELKESPSEGYKHLILK